MSDNIKTRICRQCEKEITDDKNEAQKNSSKPIQYGYNNHDVCEGCFKEISAYVGKGWRYEDFWQVEQKYPRIFTQGMYKSRIKNKSGNLLQWLFSKFNFA